MAANVEAMVREGTNALKAGRKEEARALLMKAVELDELNEDAWLWLSAVVETEEDQQTCLENVLAINPTNERARQGLKYLEQQRSGGAPVVSAPPAPPAPPPVYSAPPAQASATSTSVEWGAPTDEPSDAKAPARAPDLSEEDYDNWVSTLNLPSAPKPSSSEQEAAPGSTPFFDNDEIEEPSFDLDLPPVSTSTDPKSKAKAGKSKAPVPEFDNDFDFGASEDDAPEGKSKRRMPKMALPALPRRDKAEKPARERVVKPKPEPIEPIFAEIPEEIRATRMPGTNERLSPLVVLLLVIVLGANVAAAILLVQALFPA